MNIVIRHSWNNDSYHGCFPNLNEVSKIYDKHYYGIAYLYFLIRLYSKNWFFGKYSWTYC